MFYQEQEKVTSAQRCHHVEPYMGHLKTPSGSIRDIYALFGKLWTYSIADCMAFELNDVWSDQELIHYVHMEPTCLLALAQFMDDSILVSTFWSVS